MTYKIIALAKALIHLKKENGNINRIFNIKKLL